MAKPLRVLFVEDSADDAELLARELRRGGFDVASARVETADAMRAAFGRETWDIVIADFRLPQFSAPDALRVIQALGVDLPFIIASGAIGEDTAAASLKAGAHDFVLKSNLARLVPAVERELREAESRRERARAENGLRRSEAQFRQIVETATEGIVTSDAGSIVTFANAKLCSMLGYRLDEIVGKPTARFMDGNASCFPRVDRQRRTPRITGGSEILLVRKDGAVLNALISTSPIVDEHCVFAGNLSMLTDITDRVRAESELQAQSEELRERMQELRCLYSVSEVLTSRRNADRASLQAVVDVIPSALRFPDLATCRLTLADVQVSSGGFDFAHHRVSVPVEGAGRGGLLEVGYRDDPAIDSSAPFVEDELKLFHAVAERISATLRRVGAERALRRSEARFKTLIERGRDLIAIVGSDGVIKYASPSFEEVLGIKPAELTGRTLDDLMHPEDRDVAHERFAAGWPQSGSENKIRVRVRHCDGSWRIIDGFVRNLLDDPNVGGIVFTARDLTEQVALENQLRQAQKMEAIGRLAGGVAHDFNNMLTVISGFGTLMLAETAEGDPRHEETEEILKAARRATALTRQLLAFSRRQVLAPRNVSLNDVVRDFETMTRRLLSDDIRVTVTLDDALGTVEADPGQLEQILMNLVINARDAMPHGGTVGLETRNVDASPEWSREGEAVSPGRYAMLSVRDEGMGMDAETQSHLFEPFFTTKEHGKGTGLGLATVYGIVRQSHGFVQVRSAPGAGSTFAIFLPQVSAAAEALTGIAAAGGVECGTETIMFVEDEEAVRRLAQASLSARGYRVLVANDGAAAIALSEQHDGPIHLLVTDLVMPGMSGVELVERLSRQRPSMRVILTSGYSDHPLLADVLSVGVRAFLQKPYTPSQLACKLREVLEQAAVPT